MAIWKKPISLVEGVTNKNTLMESLGIEITAIEDNSIIGTMPVDERTHQPMGLLHGGASVALAETLGSLAAFLAADEKKTAVGLEINANHIKSVRSGIVTGKCTPLHIGRTTQVWETKITDEQNQLICVSRLTTAIKDI